MICINLAELQWLQMLQSIDESISSNATKYSQMLHINMNLKLCGEKAL